MRCKYIVLLGDGMADYPITELNGKTPLQVARTPNLDQMAQKGRLGLVDTIPAGLPPGSDVANLSIFGYDPALLFTGRAPLEAAAMGIRLAPQDVAFRLNLVTLGGRDGSIFMDDYSAGHIPTEEAREMILDLGKALGDEEFHFFPGVSYRHLLVWRNGEKSLSLKTTPPHDISAQAISPYLPQGEGQREIRKLMERGKKILENHPRNLARKKAGEKPANSLWLWGQGKAPSLTPLTERYGLTGSVISAVDLMKGIGFYAGLEIIQVPGATGYLDTNYAGKAAYALKEIRKKDFVYLHLEAPDEAAHNGKLKEKVQAIEDFDGKIVGPILQGLKAYADYRVLALPDHPTPIVRKTHTSEPVPFVIYSSADGPKAPREDLSFDEVAAKKTGLFIPQGHELMGRFIHGL
ncbi:MAG: cofactor-independent phosphoglycerate mutase [Deltaproteobacteria bacterium]|nr:cofactor-independent phosphoglycerate mutase [Deltaproteobacteria bacterium]